MSKSAHFASAGFLCLALCQVLSFTACQTPRLELAGEEASPLSAYLEILENPALVWAPRGQQDPEELDSDLAQARSEIEALLRHYAPRIWFHPAEPFGPSDPIQFIQTSSLWKRRTLGKDQKVKDRGETLPEELKQLGESYYLRLEDPTFGTGIERNWSRTQLGDPELGIKNPEAYARAPMFWKLGSNPVPRELIRRSPNQQAVLIEYWYHIAYNLASATGWGNHQGDWEGIAMLINLGADEQGRLTHRLVAAFYATHENGLWNCPTQLSWIQAPSSPLLAGRAPASETQIEAHPEAFSALGSHATYPREGEFSFFPKKKDRTGKGWNWDAWHTLRPIALEPYYGFQGRWGKLGLFPFQSGPMIPNVGGKNLPQGYLKNRASRLRGFLNGCRALPKM